MKLFLIITSLCCLCLVQANAQLYLQSGAIFTAQSGSIITLQNIDLQNNSAINQAMGAGKFLFNGTVNNTIIGTGATLFDQMEIAKTGTGKLTLAKNLTIGSKLMFTSGNVDVGNFNLQLQPAATLSGESETSRLISSGTGTASITATLNAPASVNPGNLGATITSDQNMGVTTITRGFASQSNGLPGAKSILRYYDIKPTNNASLNATLVIQYFDAELNGLNETKMFVVKSDDNINWIPVGYTIRDLNINFIGVINIPSFSRWAVSASDNPLPITLVSFNATCQTNATLLQWESATEVNAAVYVVEKSLNAVDWNSIQTIAATNNITGSHYTYTDASPTSSAYYRLRMVDKDGSFAYSAVFSGGCAVPNVPFSVYPNPAHSNATATVFVKEDGKALVGLYSSDGKILSQNVWSLQKGTNSLNLPGIALLPPGSYIVKVLLNGNTQQSRLIKQ